MDAQMICYLLNAAVIRFCLDFKATPNEKSHNYCLMKSEVTRNWNAHTPLKVTRTEQKGMQA